MRERVKNWTKMISGPLLWGIFTVALSFAMDASLVNVHGEADWVLIVSCLGLTCTWLLTRFVFLEQAAKHPSRFAVPAWIENKSLYLWLGNLILISLVILFSVCYRVWISHWFLNLQSTYYTSQVLSLVLISPILEELAFRYLLYDCWARNRFGTWKGMFIIGIFFVLSHPVTNLPGMMLYWVPTILFYLVYKDFGLYASILVHMIYNFIAI